MQEWEEKIIEKRRARAEGLAEGRAEGRAEGNCLQLIQQIKKKILKSKNLLQIADELEEAPKDIEFLYECVKDHSDKENEEIYKIYITADKKKD